MQRKRDSVKSMDTEAIKVNNFSCANPMGILHTDCIIEENADTEGHNKQFEERIIQSESKGEAQMLGRRNYGLNIRVVDKDIEDIEEDKEETTSFHAILEAEISSEIVNESLPMVGYNKPFHGTRYLHDDTNSAGFCDLCFVEPCFEVYNINVKEDKGQAASLQAKSHAACLNNQNDDSSILQSKTEEDSSEQIIDTFSNLPDSRLPRKNTTFQCPFPKTCLSETFQNNAFALFQTRETNVHAYQIYETGQDKLDVDEARNNVVSCKVMPVGERNGSLTLSQAAHMPDEMKAQLAETPVNYESSVYKQMLADSLCTVGDWNPLSIRSGDLPSNIAVRKEQKQISAGVTDFCWKSRFSTLLHTVSMVDATVLPTPMLVQHTFRDSQRIQLYAQILVYGSLIRESLPEQELMIAAFSHTKDDGNRQWAKAWSIAAERFQSKDSVNTSEMLTPTACSSIRLACTPEFEVMTPNQSPGQNATDSIGFSNLETRLFENEDTSISGSIMSKIIPLAVSPQCRAILSPLVWEMSSPVNRRFGNCNLARSLNCHQTTEQNYEVSEPGLVNTPLSFAYLPFPGTQIGHSQDLSFGSSLSVSSKALPVMIQGTPHTREHSAASSISDVPLACLLLPFSQTASGCIDYTEANVNAYAQNEDVNLNRESSAKTPSGKRMKRHLNQGVDGTTDLTLVRMEEKCISTSHAEPVVVDIGKELNDVLKTVSTSSPLGSMYYNQMKPIETEYSGILAENDSILEKAKLNAEEVASIASTAVAQSRAIWSHLCSKRNCGLISDRESIIISSDAGAAAASFLAKAAAAAAKVAFEATVQAKLIADEVLRSNISSDINMSDDMGSDEGSTRKTCIIAPKVKEKDTILKFQKTSGCQSIDAVDIEIFKQSLEDASPSAKNGQDLHAILISAKLVTEVLSQLRTVIAICDPSTSSLNTLSEGGLEVHFKQPSPEGQTLEPSKYFHDEVQSEGQHNKASEKSLEILLTHGQVWLCKDEATIETKDKHRNAMQSLQKDTKPSEDLVNLPKTDVQEELCEEGLAGETNEGSEDSFILPLQNNLSNGPNCDVIQVQKESNVQTNLLGSEVEAGPQRVVSFTEVDHSIRIQDKAVISKLNKIKEGSHVEVLSIEGLQRAWFPAQVLCLNKDKAFIRCDRILSDASIFLTPAPDQCQGWISLNEESGEQPRIRLVHPMAITTYEGTRKRRREAMGKNDWFIGEYVDAWICDGWWEGIIVRKSKDDEDELRVHFPGGKEESIKSWNLRPSLVWMDGQWVECTCSSARTEGGLRCTKRQKVDKDVTERGTMDAGDLGEVKVQKLNAMILSENKPLASPMCVSSRLKKIGQNGLDKGGSGKANGALKPENKTKLSHVNKNCNASKIPQVTPAGRLTGKSAVNKTAIVSQRQTGKRTHKPRPGIPKPRDSKFGKAQVTSESKIRKVATSATPKTRVETSDHDSVLVGATSNIEGVEAGKIVGFGEPQPPIQQSSGAQCLPSSKKTKIPKPYGLTKPKSSPSKQLQQQSKENVPLGSCNPGQGSKKSNIQDLTKKRPMFRS